MSEETERVLTPGETAHLILAHADSFSGNLLGLAKEHVRLAKCRTRLKLTAAKQGDRITAALNAINAEPHDRTCSSILKNCTCWKLRVAKALMAVK